ncbi:helix-turn-helix domain-containing protein [Catalinimonas niigatensis]|uniref:helix-turn-helix domain-containing protein n=1 Tax=Catalinimonas niigatensis TaxID=1397264 RepID=UPI00389939FB
MTDTLLFLHHIYQDSNGEGVIKLSRQDLANMLSIAKETLIRMLSEFRTEKLITLDGLAITVIGPQGLIIISLLYDQLYIYVVIIMIYCPTTQSYLRGNYTKEWFLVINSELHI